MTSRRLEQRCTILQFTVPSCTVMRAALSWRVVRGRGAERGAEDNEGRDKEREEEKKWEERYSKIVRREGGDRDRGK